MKNIRIHKLVDKEGLTEWRKTHPQPSPDEADEAVRLFFEYRPDLTMENI